MTDNRTNEELASRLRQFAESQAMDFDSPHVAMTLNEVADRLAREPTKEGIPLYGMLDLWMALNGTSHPEFDEFYEGYGYAETWARLLAEVRSRAALEAADAVVTEEQIAEVLSAQTTYDGKPWYPSELHRRQARAILTLFRGGAK